MTIGVSDPFNRAQEVCDDRGGCPGLPVHKKANNNKKHPRSLLKGVLGVHRKHTTP